MSVYVDEDYLLSFSNREEVREIVGSPKEVEAAMNFLHNNSQLLSHDSHMTRLLLFSYRGCCALLHEAQA